MDGRPDMYPHQRAEIRLKVRAGAFYHSTAGGGRGRVRNLSAGGVEISDPQPKLPVGADAEIHLIGGGLRVGPVRGEVVRETATGIAFRFTNVDSDLRRDLVTALQRM